MYTQRQPLLANEDVPLHELRTLEAGSVYSRQRSDRGHRETISLASITPSTRDSPRPSHSSSLGDQPPSIVDEGQMAAEFHLLPRLLHRWTKPYSRTSFAFDLSWVLSTLAGIGWGGAVLINSTINAPILSTDCNSYNATGVETAFLVNIEILSRLSFTEAKLLDLAWDTFVGQGLKLFHAWVLYHAISRCLTAAMEADTVSPRAYLDLRFSTVSFQSILSAFLSISFRKPFRTLRFSLWILFEIAYVLSFTTIWSASTGYISGSIPTFAIGDFRNVALSSPDLTLCWVINDDRVSPAGTTKVITGPQLINPGDSFTESGLDNFWDNFILQSIEKPSDNDLGNFIDVYSYLLHVTDFLTKSLVERIMNVDYLDNDKGLDPKHLNELPDATANSSVHIGYSGARIKNYWTFSTPSISDIGGWQLELASRIPQEQRLVLGNNTLNSTTRVAARKAAFLRNDTAANDMPYRLPYNSTIWLDGEELRLQAPFLNTSGTCTDLHGNMNERDRACVCVGGVPVNQSVDFSRPTGCLSEDGYRWGFSSGVLGVGVLLEGLWLFLTWAMWNWAIWRSTLVSGKRSGVGRIRNILDAAEAITAHLGDQHSAYTEAELEERLESAAPFGYVLEDRRGVQHIGIRSIPTSDDGDTVLRKHAKVDKETLYG